MKEKKIFATVRKEAEGGALQHSTKQGLKFGKETVHQRDELVWLSSTFIYIRCLIFCCYCSMNIYFYHYFAIREI